MPRLAPRVHPLRIGTEGPTSVFLPGLAGTTSYWKGRLGNAEKRRRVLHVDPDVTAPLAGALCLANATENWQMRVLSGMDHHPRLRAPEICQRVVERESDLRLGSAAPATANQRHLHNFPPTTLRSAGESR